MGIVLSVPLRFTVSEGVSAIEALHQRGIRLCGCVYSSANAKVGANDAGGTPPHEEAEENMTSALVVGYAKSERRDARRSRRAPQVRVVTAVATVPLIALEWVYALPPTAILGIGATIEAALILA